MIGAGSKSSTLWKLNASGVSVLSLRPDRGADYVGRNGMLKMFDALQTKRYEIVHEKADFYDLQEVGIVRLIAVKP